MNDSAFCQITLVLVIVIIINTNPITVADEIRCLEYDEYVSLGVDICNCVSMKRIQTVACRLMVVMHSRENCARNLHKFLAQVSCIKFLCKFMQVRLTTHQIKTGVLGRNK